MDRMGEMGARLLRCALLGMLLALWSGGALAARAASLDGMALIRLVHASPDAPALDVLIDGQRVATALRFADATPYVAIPAGSRSVQVLAVSAGPGVAALTATTVELRDGLAYTLVAAERLARIDAVVLTDDLSIDAGSQAYVRLVHGSPDAPPVADLAIAGGPVALRNLAFKAASPYLPLGPGTYAFEIRPAGTTQALATTGPLTLEAGRIYTIFVVGQLSDGSFRALILPDNARSGGVGSVPKTGGGGGATSGGLAPPLIGVALALTALVGTAVTRRWRVTR